MAERSVCEGQGVRMMTIEAAYALHIEDRLGSLEEGKNADLVFLSADPCDVASDDIEAIRAVLTMVDGKIEFQDDDSL